MILNFSLSAALLLSAAAVSGSVQVATERNESDATPIFKFKNVPAPARNDAAGDEQFVIVDGHMDPNSGGLTKLHDGKVPFSQDAPAENFFFDAGTAGGRLVVDLGKGIDIAQVNTYSWHWRERGPQVYTLFASDGTASGFEPRPQSGINLKQAGWKRIAAVDTRPKTGGPGGQYGVSISDSAGSLGRYRYLLFDIARTEATDRFGNTFYSEIDVIDRDGPAPEPVATPRISVDTFEADGGKYQIAIDTTEASDLAEWAREELTPVLREWYPKIVKLLPSTGYEAPRKLSVVFSENLTGVPAATAGTTVRCAAKWFRENVRGEAKGCVVHELVHVVQQYRWWRNRRAPAAPGWLVEGMADYIRWFLYEPQSRGAEITRRNLGQARYDASYRVTANFLNWVTAKYDKELVTHMNAAVREGRYSDELWKQYTGHTVQELGDEWKASLEQKLLPPKVENPQPR